MECDRHKLFVGGILRETTEEALRLHFSRYGIVLSAAVARERVTRNSRGFGFVRFSNASAVDNALRCTHSILGRVVDVKKAVPRQEQHIIQQQYLQQNGSEEVSSIDNYRTKKIFVGGLASSITEEEFRNYFERFGRIIDVVVMHDSVTNRPRGFGFVTFESEDSVENVMQNNFHNLSNKSVEVKRAIPKESIQTNNGSFNPTDLASMPTFSGFQPMAFAPEGPGYGMIMCYAPAVFGFHNLQGFHHYPLGMYGFGYPLVAQGTNMPWNNTIMPTNGFFCPPHGATPGYFPYGNGFNHPGMNIVWPAPDGNVEQAEAGTMIPRSEALTVEVSSNEGHNVANGNTTEALQMGTSR